MLMGCQKICRYVHTLISVWYFKRRTLTVEFTLVYPYASGLSTNLLVQEVEDAIKSLQSSFEHQTQELSIFYYYKADLNSANWRRPGSDLKGIYRLFCGNRTSSATTPRVFNNALHAKDDRRALQWACLYGVMAETTISSWKADQGGTIHLAITKIFTILHPSKAFAANFQISLVGPATPAPQW